MDQKIISKNRIIEAAKLLVANGCTPTLTAVRKQLGYRGSNSTIHKYLKQWKQSCFNQPYIANNVIDKAADLIEEKRTLQQTLNRQITQNEHYAQELINAEKANIVLKEEIQQLQIQLQQLQSELKELKNINNFLEQTTTDIKNKLENNDNKTIQNLQQNVDVLRAELKKINETSLEALREASYKGHETLMQEKVMSINLQSKVDSLHKELADSKKQLYDAALKYRAQTQSLLRQVDWQQRIIQEHIGEEKLTVLVEKSELMLNFNNKEAAYAK